MEFGIISAPFVMQSDFDVSQRLAEACSRPDPTRTPIRERISCDMPGHPTDLSATKALGFNLCSDLEVQIARLFGWTEGIISFKRT
jgi:hypothetical protein